MDNRKPMLELKDVPPPPHHTSSFQPFPLPPLPIPPPCLPPPQPLQDSHQQQSFQQQHGGSPKVSSCTLCEHCSTGGYGVLSGVGVGSNGNNSGGVVSLYMPPTSLEASISSSGARPGASSIASALHPYQHYPSHGSEGDALDSLHTPGGYNLQLPSFVATSQPMSSHSHLPCCSGLLHSYPSVPLLCSQSSLLPSSAPLAASLPSLPTPLRGSCLASSGYYHCGVDYSPTARGSQRATAHCDHPTTTTTAHFCSNPMHLNVERTVCLKGAPYCRDCLSKVGKILFTHCGFFLCLNSM